uniref:Uncharacterized protein n=1 Tax=Leersia perrieri TaxID=77586 RepID=A0A0D9VTT3_9ORYZ
MAPVKIEIVTTTLCMVLVIMSCTLTSTSAPPPPAHSLGRDFFPTFHALPLSSLPSSRDTDAQKIPSSRDLPPPSPHAAEVAPRSIRGAISDLSDGTSRRQRRWPEPTMTREHRRRVVEIWLDLAAPVDREPGGGGGELGMDVGGFDLSSNGYPKMNYYQELLQSEGRRLPPIRAGRRSSGVATARPPSTQ